MSNFEYANATDEDLRQWATDARDAQMWEAEQVQVRWAEAGGYAAGLTRSIFWQTKMRGTNDQEYQIYLSCANNGKGGDVTRGGAPLLTYDQWMRA
jgi:hypothetical protein